MVLLLFVLAVSFLRAQDRDTIRGPVVNITVNKETDDQGNVIRYDSTYTWFWSSGDTVMESDTAFFRRFFSNEEGWHFNPGMLMPDSLPGFIFSPFDETLDPFFFGFPDTAAFRRLERLFREFMRPFHGFPDEDLFRSFGFPEPFGSFPSDSLLRKYFDRAVPRQEKENEHTEKKGKIVIL